MINEYGAASVSFRCTVKDTTSRKVAGLSPDEVDFLNLPNLSSRTMALGSTQPLTEMSTGNLLGV
jgi:hypothetical protein